MACDRSARGDEAGGATHELDQANAVRRSHRLDVGPAQHLASDFQRGHVAKADLDIRHVVVDGFGNPDHRLGKTALFDLLLDSMGAALCPVTTDTK